MVLGFGLGGFFDGILLHQILQWHHLLSLVPGAGDLRWQVLWDGVFHAVMYAVAAAGLGGLWWARRRGDEAPGRRLVGALMVGFGLWHVVDSILSHWVLGIHRIRIDSPNPLAWDLVWFVAFGVVPLVLGGWLVRGGGQGPASREVGGRGSTQALAGGRGATASPAGGPNRRHAALPLVVLTVATVGAAAWSLVPPPGQPFTTVVFRPDVAPGAVYAALGALDARLVWTDPGMGVVVVAVAPERRWGFYGRGALLVSGSGLPAGCFDWSRA
jgi:uncharacterized membrane protein